MAHLEGEKLVRNCHGQLSEILLAVDEAIATQMKLFKRLFREPFRMRL